jgi:hypothetical protein
MSPREVSSSALMESLLALLWSAGSVWQKVKQCQSKNDKSRGRRIDEARANQHLLGRGTDPHAAGELS